MKPLLRYPLKCSKPTKRESRQKPTREHEENRTATPNVSLKTSSAAERHRLSKNHGQEQTNGGAK